MRALRQRVGMLDDERQQLLARIQQLEERVEVLYGELYAKRGVGSPIVMFIQGGPSENAAPGG